MSSKMPPVPPENRSPKGTGEAGRPPADDGHKGVHGAHDPDRQGQQGATRQNTTHQGYQQDR
ncbi:hypothetical protein [Tistrella mobilis]|uniref:hypothetical protein n=1 Tax=Tistrella mobilis TaxID=171437 RepID=UPI0035573F86